MNHEPEAVLLGESQNSTGNGHPLGPPPKRPDLFKTQKLPESPSKSKKLSSRSPLARDTVDTPNSAYEKIRKASILTLTNERQENLFLIDGNFFEQSGIGTEVMDKLIALINQRITTIGLNAIKNTRELHIQAPINKTVFKAYINRLETTISDIETAIEYFNESESNTEILPAFKGFLTVVKTLRETTIEYATSQIQGFHHHREIYDEDNDIEMIKEQEPKTEFRLFTIKRTPQQPLALIQGQELKTKTASCLEIVEAYITLAKKQDVFGTDFDELMKPIKKYCLSLKIPEFEYIKFNLFKKEVENMYFMEIHDIWNQLPEKKKTHIHCQIVIMNYFIRCFKDVFAFIHKAKMDIKILKDKELKSPLTKWIKNIEENDFKDKSLDQKKSILEHKTILLMIGLDEAIIEENLFNALAETSRIQDDEVYTELQINLTGKFNTIHSTNMNMCIHSIKEYITLNISNTNAKTDITIKTIRKKPTTTRSKGISESEKVTQTLKKKKEKVQEQRGNQTSQKQKK